MTKQYKRDLKYNINYWAKRQLNKEKFNQSILKTKLINTYNKYIKMKEAFRITVSKEPYLKINSDIDKALRREELGLYSIYLNI